MPQVRVAVVSTPRSGNTWVRRMLEKAYAVPSLSTHEMADGDWADLPDEFILQIHWMPDADFLEKLAEHRLKVVTVARHPLDVLISILHVAVYDVESERWLRGVGGDETRLFGAGPRSRAFAEYAASERAAALLGVSAAWWGRPDVARVKYEDMVADPAAGLRTLEPFLGPVRADLADVLAQTTIGELRKESTNNHFWKGRPGLWRELLPPAEATEIAWHVRPALDALQYAFDPDPSLTAEQADRAWIGMTGAELGKTLRKNTDAHRRQLAAHAAAAHAAAAERDNARELAAAAAARREVAVTERDDARLERDAARAERDGARCERDDAVIQRDEARAARDTAVAERDNARLERDAAVVLRDEARAARDEAVMERDAARLERDTAVIDRDEARVERDAAVAERDNARTERDEAAADRDNARTERDAAVAERDRARTERDAAEAGRELTAARADDAHAEWLAAREREAAALAALEVAAEIRAGLQARVAETGRRVEVLSADLDEASAQLTEVRAAVVREAAALHAAERRESVLRAELSDALGFNRDLQVERDTARRDLAKLQVVAGNIGRELDRFRGLQGFSVRAAWRLQHLRESLPWAFGFLKSVTRR